MATVSFSLDDFGAEPLRPPCRKGMRHKSPCGPAIGPDGTLYDGQCACGCACDETYCLFDSIDENERWG